MLIKVHFFFIVLFSCLFGASYRLAADEQSFESLSSKCLPIESRIPDSLILKCKSLLESDSIVRLSNQEKQALLLNLANSELIKHNPEGALKWLQEYTQIAKFSPEFPYHEARRFGRMYFMKRNQIQAEKYFSRGVEVAEKRADINLLGISYNDMSAVYKAQGKYAKALEFALKSIKYKQQTSKPIALANSYANIADINMALENDLEAEKNFLKALGLVEKPHRHLKAHLLWSLATLYVKQEKYALAEQYFNQAKHIYIEQGHHQALALQQVNYTELLLDLNQLERAEFELQSISNRLENKQDPRFLRQMIRYQLLTGEYRIAEKMARTQLDQSQKLKAQELSAQFWTLLIASLVKQEKFDQAFKEQQAFFEFEKETIKLKYAEDVKSLQAEIQLYEQTQQLNKLQKTNQVQQQKIAWLEYMTILSFIIVICALVYAYFSVLKRRTEKRLLAQQVEHHKLLYQQLDQQIKEQAEVIEEQAEGEEMSILASEPQQLEDTEHQLKQSLVDLMVKCLDIWQRSTQTGKIDFAEKSKIWKVTIDDGRLRTRTLDRYLNFNTLPKSPRVAQVLQTGHFVLANCDLPSQSRSELNANINQLMQLAKQR